MDEVVAESGRLDDATSAQLPADDLLPAAPCPGLLDALPPDLLPAILQGGRWTARAACHAFRCHIDAERSAAHLTWPRRATLRPTLLQKELTTLLERLPRLQHLDCTGCFNQHVASVAVPSVTSLNLSQGFARDLGPLSACASLTELDLRLCLSLRDLSPLTACVSLASLNLFGCRRVANISPLAACMSLTSLDLARCEQLVDVSPLAACTMLKCLSLRASIGVTGYDATAGDGTTFAPSLTSVDMRHCYQVHHVTFLCTCTALTVLDLSQCWSVSAASRDMLLSLTALTTLGLHAFNLAELSPVSMCTALRSLSIPHCRMLQEIAPVSTCASLTSLDMHGCTLSDFEPLSGCAGLVWLDLHNCVNLSSLAPLRSCTALTSLDLHRSRVWGARCRITDVGPLRACTSLTWLNVRNCDSISDLTPLSTLGALHITRSMPFML